MAGRPEDAAGAAAAVSARQFPPHVNTILSPGAVGHFPHHQFAGSGGAMMLSPTLAGGHGMLSPTLLGGHHNNGMLSPTPALAREGKDRFGNQYNTANINNNNANNPPHPYRGTNDVPQPPQKVWNNGNGISINGSINSSSSSSGQEGLLLVKATSTSMSPAKQAANGIHRRPRPSDTFDNPEGIGRTPTETTNGTGSSGSCGGDSSKSAKSNSQRDLWKVKLAGGEFLDSSSYGGNSQEQEDNDNVHKNATKMLRRLKLADNNGDDDDDQAVSDATTKASNFTFQMKIQDLKNVPSIRGLPSGGTNTAYYRPVDTLEQKDGGNNIDPPPPPPPPTASSKSASSKQRSSRGGSSRSVSKGAGEPSSSRVTQPSDLSIACDSLPYGMSSLSYNSSEFDEDETVGSSKRRTPHSNRSGRSGNRKSMARKSSRSRSPINPATLKNKKANTYHNNQHRHQEPSSSSFANNNKPPAAASESDNDDEISEFKRMESVTHTFQRNDAMSRVNVKSRKWDPNFSAVPLSNIGVDVRNDYEEQQRVCTPREAANAGCSIGGFFGELLGVTPPNKGDGNGTPVRSPFDIVKNMLCSPDRPRTEGGTPNRGSRRKASASAATRGGNGAADDDDWSVGVDIQSEAGNRQRYKNDFRRDDDTNFSEVESHYDRNNNNRNRNRRSCTPYRTNLETDCSSYNNNNNDRDRRRSCTPYRGSSNKPNNNTTGSSSKSNSNNNNNNNNNNNQTLQEKYDKNISYRHYHREDLSYYGTEAGSTYQQSHYSCAGDDDEDYRDDRSDSVSRLSEPFHKKREKYRDSPFVRRR